MAGEGQGYPCWRHDRMIMMMIYTTLRYRGGCYSFPWIVPLCHWSLAYKAECYVRRLQVLFFFFFWVFGRTPPGIEPQSPEPLVNTLPTRPMLKLCTHINMHLENEKWCVCVIYIYIYIYIYKKCWCVPVNMLKGVIFGYILIIYAYIQVYAWHEVVAWSLKCLLCNVWSKWLLFTTELSYFIKKIMLKIKVLILNFHLMIERKLEIWSNRISGMIILYIYIYWRLYI